MASEKSNAKTFVRTDSSGIAGEKKIQQAKLIQSDDETTGITNHGHPIHKNNHRYNKLAELVYHTPEPVSYQGGEFALAQFLETNNSYNSIKYYESIEGIVYLKLLVDTTGKAIEKKILRGIGIGIDEEALRLSSLLKFNPAKDSTGKAIRSDFILKVKFEKHHYPIEIIDGVTVKVDEPIKNKNTSWHLRSKRDAQYPGGRMKMQRFFRKNLHYPLDKEHSIQGRVELLLEIDEMGKLADIAVYKSDKSEFSEEAIRLVRLVEKWEPAIVKHRHSSGYMEVNIKIKMPHKTRYQKNTST